MIREGEYEGREGEKKEKEVGGREREEMRKELCGGVWCKYRGCG
jgi:hypothetical protein